MAVKNQKKVLVIPSWYPPKGGYFFREHSVALASAGLKVDVLAGLHTSLKTLSPGNSLRAFKTGKTSFEGITEHTKKYWIIPFSEKHNFQAWVSMMLRFFKRYQAEHGRPDIILAHSSIWAGLVAAFIREKYDVPYVITEHRSRFIYNTPEARAMFKPWFFSYLQTAFEGAEKVITVSDALQPFIKQIAPAVADRLLTIPNLVDTDFFKPAEKPKEIKPFRFFSLANLIPLKGMDSLIEAFALLHNEQAGEFLLTIGGEGPERGKLEKLLTERGLNVGFSVTGRLSREEILGQMQDANAFVLASHFEAFGVVYIEAMACGLPVVATRAGGPEGFIRESEGILVKPGNIFELAAALKKMKDNYQKFDKEKIRKYAVSAFGKQVLAKQYVKLFNEIVNKKKK